ncbi:MAG: cyclic nucleotide-binding domain-containing protein [Mariprofundus sp.]
MHKKTGNGQGIGDQVNEDRQQGDQLQVYADLVQLYPDNEAYIKQYAELLLDEGKTSTATEMLRHLHTQLLKKGDPSKADALVKEFPLIGRIRKSSAAQNAIHALLPSSTRNRLWLRLHQKSLREGQHLFHRGEMGDTLYLVCEGELAEFTRGAEGKPIMLNLIGPGDVIGEDKLLNPGTFKSDVVANKDSVVVKLPRKKMTAALVSNPALKTSLQRKNDLRRMVAIISASSVLQQLPLNMRQNLAEESYVQKFAAGSTIYKAGEKLKHVDLIIQGEAAYQLQNSGGIKQLKALKPGALIGETVAIHDIGCPADMVTRNGVTMIHMPYATFINVVEAYPPLKKSLTSYAEKQRAQLMRKLNELQTQQL